MNSNQMAKLEKIMTWCGNRENIHGAVFNITSKDGSLNWSGSVGNFDVDSRYYIASINKLFVSALILRLIRDGRLTFTNKLSEYASSEILKGLHVYKGRDYSKDITILHLLSNTSGLPCYLSDKPENGPSAMKELEAGIDQSWPMDKVIERVKTLKPHFPPGEGNKAKYIDTNHQLLNIVIEAVSDEPVQDALNRLFQELGMTETYVCENPKDVSYVFPYYKKEKRDISEYITSTNNDIISNAHDQMLFIRAFFRGYFYPEEKLSELMDWRSIFFPFKYGIGIQKFYTPRVFSPSRSVPDMIGHCGSTGTVAFYIPDEDLFITGTTNQQANPSVAFQTMIRMILALK